MIGKLTGNISDIFEEFLILDVGGVGYRIWVTKSTITACTTGDNAIFYIETHVREDHIHLYGFRTIEEKDAFTTLQTVNGVGAKVALTILSALSPSEIQGAIDAKDKNAFLSVSGIGPKLAERILLELKNKTFSTNASYIKGTSVDSNKGVVEDAAMALINLGINRNEAISLVKDILKNSPDLQIDQVIKIALQSRMK
ncbi:MAG: Holliday junction ATP-dependent helicase RuvA [Pseudomonadota bacterium]|jgi:Holliday junction DNA helicase RuvA